MSSRFPRGQRSRAGALALGFLAVSAAALAALPGVSGGPLRVCADPDNPPFSSADATGFENRLARMLADELGTEARFYWWPQRRGFVRNTLDAKACDVVMALPAGSPGVLTTPPWYEAGYVFAWRPDRVGAGVRSYDDPALPNLKVGIPLVGNDMAATPPGDALARRRMTDNVIGFAPLGPTVLAARMMAALADGTIDVAVLWAPQAAYFARRQDFPVRLAPARDDATGRPQVFAMSVAVRHDEPALRDALAAALVRLAPRIDEVLRDAGLPDGAATLAARRP